MALMKSGISARIHLGAKHSSAEAASRAVSDSREDLKLCHLMFKKSLIGRVKRGEQDLVSYYLSRSTGPLVFNRALSPLKVHWT